MNSFHYQVGCFFLWWGWNLAGLIFYNLQRNKIWLIIVFIYYPLLTHLRAQLSPFVSGTPQLYLLAFLRPHRTRMSLIQKPSVRNILNNSFFFLLSLLRSPPPSQSPPLIVSDWNSHREKWKLFLLFCFFFHESDSNSFLKPERVS